MPVQLSSPRRVVRPSLPLLSWFTHAAAKKEAKRLEKIAKQAVKTTTSAVQPAAKKERKEKEKKESAVAEEWINTTPAGEKKGVSLGLLEDLAKVLKMSLAIFLLGMTQYKSRRRITIGGESKATSSLDSNLMADHSRRAPSPWRSLLQMSLEIFTSDTLSPSPFRTH